MVGVPGVPFNGTRYARINGIRERSKNVSERGSLGLGKIAGENRVTPQMVRRREIAYKGLWKIPRRQRERGPCGELGTWTGSPFFFFPLGGFYYYLCVQYTSAIIY